jgi:hypothetical protein
MKGTLNRTLNASSTSCAGKGVADPKRVKATLHDRLTIIQDDLNGLASQQTTLQANRERLLTEAMLLLGSFDPVLGEMLRTTKPDPRLAARWLGQQHRALDGQTPLAFIVLGQDEIVWQLLDTQA